MRLFLSLAAASLAPAAAAQTVIQIPLNYNFNGIVHAGEAGVPDDPAGYRSISDRGLDFTAGVPTNAQLAPYAIVSMPGVLDIVHVGDRDTVDGGNYPFDLAANGDNLGIQPTWLPSTNQTGPQTTVLPSPITLGQTANVRVLFQVSNGGGALDVVLGFQSGATASGTISAGDWFGGPYLGTGSTDSAIADNNLSLTEGVVDFSASAGETLTSISFQNPSNFNGGYAILACNVETSSSPTTLIPVALNYNFNGIVHTNEDGVPDDPNGYRSISDRALDFTTGIPSNPISDPFTMVSQAGVLDIVHLGDRNFVDGGSRPWDAVADGDNVGIQPTWLANSDQTGPQTTTLASPVPVDASTKASVLFQISNGGGSFDVTFNFQSGTSVTSTLAGGDWFGGSFLGTGSEDSGLPDANLNLTATTIDLAASAGQSITSITFSNSTNGNAGVAIVAMNFEQLGFGTVFCDPAVANSTGASGMMSADGSSLVSDNDVTLIADSLPNFSFGFFITSRTQGFIANPGGSSGNLCLSGAIGRYVGPGQIQNSGANGSISLAIDLTRQPTPNGLISVLPGDSWSFQLWHRDSVGGSTTSNFTNGLELTFQ
ncbi:hypothetical protein Poly30_07340 [Planctomycetes bacterium Poly30]|uniref:Uncharacterized protein n=1 Tax=Saltatorellus ferox TaxID=2528018 RepID=A0A518EMC0_9BACT|nr:hypothetical protein Poly30_07340 [Planctomycetes bacterium Poly30]